jgi:SAM-dependent methyltransferase
MTPLEAIHNRYIYRRRIQKLRDALEKLIPPGAKTLDVGCGDGWLTHLIQERRPDISIEGIDVLVRPGTHVPVTGFDGRKIPFPDKSFDTVTVVDVLHHADDPFGLLTETARVARNCVVIKDHLLQGFLARETLEFMDRMGNARYNVTLPYNYWTRAQWDEAFGTLGLRITSWEGDVGLYPWPVSTAFGRALHFVARLETAEKRAPGAGKASPV